MKKRRIIILAAVMAIVVLGFVLSKEHRPQPVLLFKGYERFGTNGDGVAKFELRNTTSKTIWLFLSGTGAALEPQLLERPRPIRSSDSRGVETNRLDFSGGPSFMGEALIPGNNFAFDFPISRGRRPEQVGVCFYIGNYANGHDFVTNLTWPAGVDWANTKGLKGKFENLREKAEHPFKAPRRHEVWCRVVLSSESKNFDGASNPPDGPPQAR
jgi:hypothetical protein